MAQKSNEAPKGFNAVFDKLKVQWSRAENNFPKLGGHCPAVYPYHILCREVRCYELDLSAVDGDHPRFLPSPFLEHFLGHGHDLA